jgi:[acyl-carrier-protein] S-malonyltransferase
MPTPTAILFPGQGSQAPGMRDLAADWAPELLDRCLELVGDDPFARVDESTRFAQPAIFCASVAGWRRAAEHFDPPVAVAGHSLGELAALVAAGALDALVGLELVVVRGRTMAEAAERGQDGTMLALLGADVGRAAALAESHGASVANENAPDQIVLSGSVGALRSAAAAAQGEGLRALELGVAGAFHSPAMGAAAAPFAEALADARFEPPSVPVVSCLTGRRMRNPRRELTDGLTRPVRWTATMRGLHDLGARRFADVGPGHVLARLVRRNLPDAEALALADLEVARV